MQPTCRTGGNRVDEEQPMSFAVVGVVGEQPCCVKVSHRNIVGDVPMSSECVIMEPKRMRLEAYDVDSGVYSDAVSTLRRAQGGKLISKQHQQVNKRNRERCWIDNRVWTSLAGVNKES
jgi:hypothetical protein